MNSSDKTEKPKRLTAKQLSEESMAIFVGGQVMGLMSQLNLVALERFYNSPRSNPEQGSDFRYRKEMEIVIRFHKELFKSR
jgi:hypothetical protein